MSRILGWLRENPKDVIAALLLSLLVWFAKEVWAEQKRTRMELESLNGQVGEIKGGMKVWELLGRQR